MKMKTLLFIYLALMMTLTACGVGDAAGSTAPLEGEWTLLTLNNAPLLAGSTINVRFEDDKITGYSGCNSYGGTYTAKNTTLQLGEIAVTLMACLDDGVMMQEQAYLKALSSVARFRLDGDRLELLDASGAPLLTYIHQEAFTGDPAALIGTNWKLLTLNGSPLDETLSFTLAFTQNRYSGLAGCRHFEGDYQAGDGDIAFPMITMVEATCPDADDAYWALEGRFTDALSWARHWRIVNGQLEIRTMRGEVLVFAP
ncbi:MAG TPA: META domain-containing protein [Anaerolineae bacterium]|nr:META domain-containing protein [Anaerolineae bacterium]HQK14874.1 META domain-containing protein [Anaerolineae bacterium]